MVQYDAYGWPINPATGEAWDLAELVADPTLPLPRDAWAVQQARDKATGAGAPKRKRKQRARRSSRRSTRPVSAATVLARQIAVGPFEAGILATARRMDELAAAKGN